MREYGRDWLRPSERYGLRHQPGGGAGRRAKVAVVGGVGVVVPTAIRVVMNMGSRVLVLMPVLSGSHFLAFVTVLDQLRFDLDRRPGARALHGDRVRPPDREEHCEQQQEPEAKRFHGS